MVEKFDDISDLNVSEFDFVILSGSRDSSVVWQHDDFQDEISLIRSLQIPLIGICFGCELIAYSFGGTLKELPIRHKGIRSIKITDNNFYSKSEISVYENHRWIIDKMPEGFKVLACSDDGPEAIKHSNRPIYGLQFHPENFVDETEGNEVFLKLFQELR